MDKYSDLKRMAERFEIPEVHAQQVLALIKELEVANNVGRALGITLGNVVEGRDALVLAVANLKAENEALRKDKDRLDALESNFWDVRHNSHPIADTGDSSSSLEIVGHWMDKPFERVIGENYSENLRAAIDQAMKAPAYPPARPEYEFDELADFGGGSGNKARRRAESMGIDYDKAMGKESKS